MKIILFVLSLLWLSEVSAQCEYSEVKYDNTTNTAYIKSLPITLDIYETPFNGRIILASLIRTGDQYFIEIEITKDSSAQELKPICFEKGSRLSFSLKDNSIISLRQREEKICGVKFYDEKTEYYTVSNYARFILNQSAFESLLKSEIIMMNISSETFEKTYVLKEEIEDTKNNEVVITQPGRFFIDNIKCMTNPKF